LAQDTALQSKPSLEGYAFQTEDFADVRGFSGKRMTMLVVLDPAGNLLATELVQHVEPLFAKPGTASVFEDFTQQFENLNLCQGSRIGRWSETLEISANSARLTGVHKVCTIAVKAINRNGTESSMAVAATKLDGTFFASFSTHLN
jgi:NosR/NirI family nitrous oxide reductase transcriptional regulator